MCNSKRLLRVPRESFSHKNATRWSWYCIDLKSKRKNLIWVKLSDDAI